MIFKKILLIFTILITYGCGFNSIYAEKNKKNFSIGNISFDGNTSLNNYIKSNLIRYQNNNKTKFSLDVKTVYTKKILTKNKTSKITNYEIIAETKFFVSPINREFSFVETKIMDSMSDKFEEKKYEKTIQENFSKSFVDKLIFELDLIQ